MMRSMFSGVSGLKVHQTRMDVIGNNIANVNTVGYKSQRVTFSDVFSQTLSSATAANDDTGRGGVNAMQVGLGVNVSAIDMLMTQGAAQRTDNPFDVMINGDGFMIVKDGSERYFTRAGALRLDEQGNLVTPSGLKVQGWPATLNDKGEYVINQQEVQDINLFSKDIKSMAPKATEDVSFTGNISQHRKNDEKLETSMGFYDSLGNYFTAVVNFTKEGGSSYKVDVSKITDEKGRQLGTIETVDGKQTIKAATVTCTLENTALAFDEYGKLILTDITKEAFINFAITTDSQQLITKEANGTLSGVDYKGKITSPIKGNCSGLTHYASKDTVDAKYTNGNAAGTLSGYSIAGDGIVNAKYTNGAQRKVAQVVLANFDNPAGLEKVGDNLYSETTNSGKFDGIGEAGEFSTGVLEMSNVDLSSEFTDMIITQRGFQANSRIITVSDEMLQELTNLKR